jgi:hypothetical protein
LTDLDLVAVTTEGLVLTLPGDAARIQLEPDTETEALTVQAWVNLTDIPTAIGQTMLLRGDGSFDLWLSDGGEVGCTFFEATPGGGNIGVGLGNMTVNEWCYIGCSYDSVTSTFVGYLYSPGPFEFLLPFTAPGFDGPLGTPTSQTIHVGTTATEPGANVTVRIDDMQLHRRALSPDELVQARSAGRSVDSQPSDE